MIRKLPSLIPWPWHRSPVKPWPYLRRAAALLALSASLSAAEITVTTPIPMQPYAAHVTEPISVNGFDPALGTLTSVRINIEMHQDCTARAENQAPGAGLLTWSTNSGLRLATVSNETLFSEAFDRLFFFKRCAAFDSSLDFLGPSGFTQQVKRQTTVFSAYITGDPAELQRFVGAGPRPFLVERTGAQAYVGETGQATAWLAHYVGGRLEVVYGYQ